MTKRLIEFNCGDPKSNQQTASKVECQVTIHNHGDNIGTATRPTRASSSKRPTRVIKPKPLADGIKLNEEVEVFDSTAYLEDRVVRPNEDRVVKANRTTIKVEPKITRKPEQESSTEQESNAEQDEDSASECISTFGAGRQSRSMELMSTRVITPVRKMQRNIPATNEQFVVVASQPTVSAIEIEENIEFHKKRAEILTHILCDDNIKLLANLIDASGKVIISQQDFCELVALMLSTDEHKFEPSQIKLVLREEIVSSCLKVQVSPFKAIVEIKIDNHDFNVVHNEAANVLKNVYNISTDMVYAGVFGLK